MATRIFCDNCGNTVKEAIEYSYGPYKQIRREEHERMTYMQAMAGTARQQTMQGNLSVGVGLQGSVIPKVTAEMIHVDLCQTCVPIWMSRVRNLTQQSDPEEK